MHALLSCSIHVRDLLFTIRKELASVHKGAIFVVDLFPFLEQLCPVSADITAFRYIVQPIASLM